MISIFEMCWTGTTHAPGNSATTQIVARAWPEQDVVFHADASHIAELQRDASLTTLPNVRFSPVPVSSAWPGRPAVVSAARAWQEFSTVLRALRAAPRHEPQLVFLISTTATGSAAAAWASRLSGRQVAVQVGLHGNLSDAFGWRSRNPVSRAADLHAALVGRHPVPLRFLVLEEGIKAALEQRLPAAARRTDALPLPINPAELCDGPAALPSSPIRFGFVGLGTADKGIDIFLRLASAMRTRHGDRAEFVHVGQVPGGANLASYAVLRDPPATALLSRDEFTRRLGGLHHVVLPFGRGYYDLSASGALMDAITWLRPVITTRVPLTERLFEEFGDVGVLCDDEVALAVAVEEAIIRPDPERYLRQVEALRRARTARHPAELAQRYRHLVECGFPDLFKPAA